MIKKILIVAIVFIFMILFTRWANNRNEKMMEWADKYEACVMERYETTPSEYYIRIGSYPECDTTK